MIGIIVQLAFSWLLVWLFEKKDLAVLGFRPTKQRVIDFFLFFLITAACAISGFLMRMYFGERWELNPVFSLKLFVYGLWWNIKSVFFEELIFRGVVFYILIKRLGVIKAITISAIAFGIYHWFSFEIIGNVKQMIFVFMITGIMGVLYAYGYAKTFSLYIPCAIHLGWNFTRNFVFSEGQIGNGVLVQAQPAYTATVSYFVYFFVIYFPIVCAIVINFLLLKRKAQAQIP
jgi:membrane protease YdiL (CAAX protease family)